MTAIVDRLERQGWVRRCNPPKDHRDRPVFPTVAEQQLVRPAEHGHRAYVDRVFAGLDAGELIRSRDLLEKLQTHLPAIARLTGNPHVTTGFNHFSALPPLFSP